MADQKLRFNIFSPSRIEHVIIQMTGPASLVNVESLKDELDQLVVNQPRLVVFDMSACSFICSLAIGAIMEFHRKMKNHGGEVRFAGLNELNGVVFNKLNLQHVFAIYETAEDALAAPVPSP